MIKLAFDSYLLKQSIMIRVRMNTDPHIIKFQVELEIAFVS